jgi:hypothetical protein
MTYRHDYQADDPSSVRVGELIDRVGREGLPVRLTNWPQRMVPADLAVGEWPTGELPRITQDDLDGDDLHACSRRTGIPLPANDFVHDAGESEELWGNRGPRPYQGIWHDN